MTGPPCSLSSSPGKLIVGTTCGSGVLLGDVRETPLARRRLGCSKGSSALKLNMGTLPFGGWMGLAESSATVTLANVSVRSAIGCRCILLAGALLFDVLSIRNVGGCGGVGCWDKERAGS